MQNVKVARLLLPKFVLQAHPPTTIIHVCISLALEKTFCLATAHARCTAGDDRLVFGNAAELALNALQWNINRALHMAGLILSLRAYIHDGGAAGDEFAIIYFRSKTEEIGDELDHLLVAGYCLQFTVHCSPRRSAGASRQLPHIHPRPSILTVDSLSF